MFLLRTKPLILVGLLLAIAMSSTTYGQKPALILNIDNPKFRKLVIALPQFAVPENADDDLKKLARDGSQELGRLLNFSGLFNIMAEAAYSDLVNSNKKLSIAEVEPNRGLDGIETNSWKQLGIESVTLGELRKEPQGYVIALRTADTYRNQLVLGTKFTKVSDSQFNRVLRKYADALLKEYTGKPGIFSSKLVFVGQKKKGDYKQIFVADFDGSNVIQITSDNSPHLSPNWSPDGKYITYTSYEDGNPDMFIYELATGRKKKLSGRKGLNSGSNWSHNGRLVAFTGSNSGDTDIFTIPRNGGNPKPLIRGVGLDVDPTFSPDGRFMAFVSGRYGNPHIFLATLKWEGDSTVRVINDKRLTFAGWYNATPSWSPDAQKIAFAGYDRDTDRFDLFMMNHDGSELERLTIRAGDNERPAWSPNGQMIVFQSNRVRGRDVKGASQLYLMNRDGSGQRLIHTGLYDAQTPQWGPPME